MIFELKQVYYQGIDLYATITTLYKERINRKLDV